MCAYYLGKELAPGADINSLLTGAYNLSRNQSTPLNTQTSGTLTTTPRQATVPSTTSASGGCRNVAAPGLCNSNEVESKTITGYRCCPKKEETIDKMPCTNGKCVTGFKCVNGYCEPDTSSCVDQLPGGGCPKGYLQSLTTGKCCPTGIPCYADTDCPDGQECANGVCKDKGRTECFSNEHCPDGYQCVSGKCKKIVQCTSDANCPTGQKCVNGVCTSVPDETCPEGTGEAMDGCACGKWYTTMKGTCPTGYVFVGRTGTNWDGYKPGAKGRCECQAYYDKSTTKTTSGEYKYPEEMQNLMDLLLGRATDLLGKDTGYSQEAQDAMFGQNFDRIRQAETGTRNTLEEQLARSGMLGTGTGIGALSDLSQSTENNITDVARQLFVANEEKKKQDLLDYTNLASALATSGVSYEQIQEAINAARRGEGQNWLAMLLALYQSMLGSAS